MIDLGLHAVFTFNAAMVCAVLILFLARHLFPLQPREQEKFVLISTAVLALRVLFVVVFVYAFPERVLTPDSVRYMFEIRQIAEAPWEWNPITGTGPYYQVTPKMGMSYLYGVILFVHGLDSLYAVLVLNIIFGLFTALAVFLLTARLALSTTPGYLAMLLTAVYPETLFWTSRVARENVTLFLVPALVYVSVRLYETYRLRYLAFAVGIVGSLFLVRAQLVLFALLIPIFFGIRSLFARNRGRALAVTGLAGVLVFFAFSAFESQIRRAAGSAALELMTLDTLLVLTRAGDFLSNFGSVLSPVAREGYGAVGLVMIPFAAGLGFFLILTLLRFRSIFAFNRAAAGLILFLSFTFLAAMAALGLINIRFRATIAPLLLSLVAVAVHYYWTILRVPQIRLR